jgi:lipopolysaccharide transport system permease protein
MSIDVADATADYRTADYPTIVIRPRNGFGGIRIRELWESRFLLLRLARRDLTLRYRQTALGITWVILQPLLAAGVLSFVFGRVAKLSGEGVPYFALTMSGYVGWSCFSTIVAKASTSILANAGMISKVFFPRLLLPLSAVVSTLVDVAVAVALLLGVLVFTGVGISLHILFILPMLLGFSILAFGIGAAMSALAVPYRDINYVLPVMLQLLLYGSPIAYGLSNVPESIRRFIDFNPLVGLLEGMRWASLPDRVFPTSALVRSGIGIAVILTVGLLIFERVEREFADVI